MNKCKNQEIAEKIVALAPDEKEIFLEKHFGYEIEMLHHAFKKCPNGKAKDNNENMAIECFLLHARNLQDFFLGQKNKLDDALAIHFMEESEQTNWNSRVKQKYSEKDELKELNYKIGKHLVHLTYTNLR